MSMMFNIFLKSKWGERTIFLEDKLKQLINQMIYTKRYSKETEIITSTYDSFSKVVSLPAK